MPNPPTQGRGEKNHWKQQAERAEQRAKDTEAGHDMVVNAIKEQLLKVERERVEWQRSTRHANRERDEAKRGDAWQDGADWGAYAAELEADRDRLQRECERLRGALEEILHLVPRAPSEGSLVESVWQAPIIARSALDALEKPE